MNSSKSQGVEKLDVELTENGTYDYTPKGYGYNKAHIVVNTPEIKNQEKNINITQINITQNGHSEIVPDPEFTGMNKVDITVDVHPSERLVRTYTENGVYPIEGEYNGGEITVNIGGDVEKYKYLVNKADEDSKKRTTQITKSNKSNSLTSTDKTVVKAPRAKSTAALDEDKEFATDFPTFSEGGFPDSDSDVFDKLLKEENKARGEADSEK